ncbi:MAG: DUF1002 domain-containing protein [Anaerobutyricum soehngenii]
MPVRRVKVTLKPWSKKENELDQYKVAVKVTNKDEHKYLDDYLDSSVIGTHALSSLFL